MNIPKTIHYFYDNENVWQKNNKSQVRMCLYSWHRFCPEYKIICWTDTTKEFKEILKKSKFVKRAYELKLWAFVSDYLRLYILYKYGGIYLDTDVQLLGNFDKFLNNDFFISIEGDIRNGENIPEPAVMGSKKHHKLLKDCMKIYENDDIFKMENFIANVIMKQSLIKLYSFKTINFENVKQRELKKTFNSKCECKKIDNLNIYLNERIWRDINNEVCIYPSEYFCPCWDSFKMKAFTTNTVAIHWNQSSWFDNYRINYLKNLDLDTQNYCKNITKMTTITFNYAIKYVIKKIFSINSYINYIKRRINSSKKQ